MQYPIDLVETTTLFITDNLKNMEQLDTFIKADLDALISYHMSLGTHLRNFYKMWSMNTQYDNSGIPIHVDDLSFEYIKEAQRLLQVKK
jgi:hypothetical protein